MKFTSISWAGRYGGDRYFGPFTFTPRGKHGGGFAIMLGSGDGDEYPGCRLRIGLPWFTLHVALPPIIKPWRQWHEIRTEPTRSQMIEQGREPGYWDSYDREYGFILSEGALHLHFGPQTHDSETTRSKLWFYPWREYQCIRHSLYDTEGEHFADLPMSRLLHRHSWTVGEAIRDVCPVAKYQFADFDGEVITATCRIEEREWKRGKGLFRLLFLGRNKISRVFDVSFSSEVGKRKGSWKGGTVGHSGDIAKGEALEAAFRRYCEREGLTFIGEAAQ